MNVFNIFQTIQCIFDFSRHQFFDIFSRRTEVYGLNEYFAHVYQGHVFKRGGKHTESAGNQQDHESHIDKDRLTDRYLNYFFHYLLSKAISALAVDYR